MKKMFVILTMAMMLSLAVGSTVYAACEGGAANGVQTGAEQCDVPAASRGNACPATCTDQCVSNNCGGGRVSPATLGTEYAGQIGLGGKDIRSTIASIIRTAMGLLGIVAVVIILIGGFTWMTAGGNDDKVGEAKKWIFAGIIGLAIILSAYALSSFVINNLISATVNPDVYTGPSLN